MLQALILFKELYPSYRTEEINASIKRAAIFIESRQREDGSWFVLMRHLLTYLTNMNFTLRIDNTHSFLAGWALGVYVLPMGPSFRLKV